MLLDLNGHRNVVGGGKILDRVTSSSKLEHSCINFIINYHVYNDIISFYLVHVLGSWKEKLWTTEDWTLR
jgi:hypothetical protein